jgi:hypothetical protein
LTTIEQLAEETGGVAWFPETAEEMIIEAADAARDIDSQYVVTYNPQRPLAEATPGEHRKLDVISRATAYSFAHAGAIWCRTIAEQNK